MSKITGGCLCGAIRYEVNGEPVRAANCHCDDCRRATGSSFGTNVFFKEDDVKIVKGTPKRFQHPADSGNTMTKMFCDNCGSQVFGTTSGRPGVMGVRVGSMDDASSVKPTMNVYASRVLHFTVLDPALEAYDKLPG